jgi:hypothetical protein
LATQLRVEYDANVVLRREAETLKAEVARLVIAEEVSLAATLEEKALNSGNKMIFPMLLEKSREVFDYAVFKGAARGPGAGAVIHGTKDAKLGDMLTLKFAVKLWSREIAALKAQREKEREEEERRRAAEEEARRVRAEREAAVEEVRKIVRALEEQLENARKIMAGHQQQVDELERALALANEKAARAASAAKAREEALKAELVDVKKELEKTVSQLADLQSDYEASQEALRRADEAFASERSKLQGIIRQIQSELHEAMVLAKHMRETALKAKRDAAGSVSPAKFAELIAQLEAMRSQLSVYSKECDVLKEKNALFTRKLDKNQRQLELERQFLPLLRKVRGPVGPKFGVNGEDGPKRSKDATQAMAQNMMPPLGAGASPGKMRMSQSMGALTDTRAQTAAPGGRSGGFQDDQTRFASSLGFASSGQGTPIRG